MSMRDHIGGHGRRWRCGVLLLLYLVMAGCSSDGADSAKSLPSAPEVDTMLPVVALPFDEEVNHVLVQDFDGDGLSELSITSHAGNVTGVFWQPTPRTFAGPTPVESVGYHPDDLLTLSDAPLRLLMCAEGSNQLQLYEPDPEQGLRQLATQSFPTPRSAILLKYPDLGDVLAVARYNFPSLYLIPGFDMQNPADPSATIELKLGSSEIRGIADMVSADLDGDGREEVIAAVSRDRVLQVVTVPPADSGAPRAEELYRFERFRPHVLVPFDYNGDGAPDLLVAGETDATALILINQGVNQGSMRFSPVEFDVPDWGVLDAAIGADRQGQRYLLMAGHEKLALYRLAEGMPPSAPTVIDYGRRGLVDVELSDVDNDGFVDAVVARVNPIVVFGPLSDAFNKHGEEIAAY